MLRVSDYIVQFLLEMGTDTMFLLTGNGAMHLNDAIVQRTEMNYYCARNEAAAPVMAAGWARTSGKLGAACVTSGPGAVNAVAGLAEAFADSVGILVLSGQVSRAEMPRGDAAGIRSFGTAGIDIVSVVKPLTKYAAVIDDPTMVRYHLERAYHAATTGRPGPVWLDVPQDVQSAWVDERGLTGYQPPPEASAGSSVEAAVDQVMGMLREGQRPLLVGGQGLKFSGMVAEFVAAAEAAGIPFVLTRPMLDAVPFSHPLNTGLGGIKGQRFAPQVMGGADVVVALGARLAPQFAGPNCSYFAPTARLVMVDVTPAEIAQHGERTAGIVCDLAAFLPQLRARLQAVGPIARPWAEQCANWKASLPMTAPKGAANPIDIYYFMARLDDAAPDGATLVTDTGSNYYAGGQAFRFERNQREITSAALLTMGTTIPNAMGASAANQNIPVLAVTGDGSLELNIQELKTISYYSFNIKLFVINNGGYVSMRNWQDSHFDGRRIGSDSQTGIETLDLKKVAEAFDLRYEAIVRAEDVDGRLREILAIPGPVFVEVVCDPEQIIIEPFGSGSPT